MSYPINYPTPQGANVQIFKASNSKTDWVKPQGASFVWFTLIGAGGSGDTTTAGASGAVTNFMGPAFLMPDVLRIQCGKSSGGIDTEIRYQQKDGTGYKLLEAKTATGSTAGAATASNYFSAMGFYQSVAGANAGSGIPSTTFLNPGDENTANYGYSVAGNGYFQMQPIIVGLGGTSGSARAGIGCGGSQLGAGGDGMVVIITW